MNTSYKENDILETQMDKIRNLRYFITTTLKEVDHEYKTKKTYVSQSGCNKDNFRRIFKIYYTYDSLENKEILKESVYITLYILWTQISEEEKKKYLTSSKNCKFFKNIRETFAILDQICKWVKLNSLTNNEKLSYLIFDLNNIPEKESNQTNMILLPKINVKIQEINEKLAKSPEDITLMDSLYELIILFHKLKDVTETDNMYENIKDIVKTGSVYGMYYYTNIYNAILLFWKFIQTYVNNIQTHPRYPYIIMNMNILNKTYKQNKVMNKITRSTLKNMQNIIPKKKENVNKLKNAKLDELVYKINY